MSNEEYDESPQDGDCVSDVSDDAAPPPQQGRVARFVDAYGWRAYAIPILAVATVIALIGVLQAPRGDANDAQSASPTSAGATSASSSSAAESTTAAGSATDTTASPVTPAEAQPTTGYAQVGDLNLNVVPGSSAVFGTSGDVVTYDVAIEGGIVIDAADFAAQVDSILSDPRSWIAPGQLRMQRVDNGQAQLHITLVTPLHVETYCPGYQTNGYTSCRYGNQVVINLARWSEGVPYYDGHLTAYRQYVVNHEVGHFLGHGHGHVPCPGAGAKAPVMQQQTLGLVGCIINAWPYPNGPTDNFNAPA